MTYATQTIGRQPNDLITRAIKLAPIGHALDLGSGAFNEARAMAEVGFFVDAVDVDDSCAQVLPDNIHFTKADIKYFPIGIDKYSIAAAINSLPFLKKEDSIVTILKMKAGLKKDGILALSVFGEHDAWAQNPKMSFFSNDELKALLIDMKHIYWEERTEERPDIMGNEKSWHLFRVIAKK